MKRMYRFLASLLAPWHPWPVPARGHGAYLRARRLGVSLGDEDVQSCRGNGNPCPQPETIS